ncbi:mannitol-1-phosphate 5-dehydrogenase [Xylocopilactobacillus apis]|uniref:Mannitol-1-phosphate 5-dehydrogenase n=1 Tax=Xylocopilactobacillus apis TaxID=2932183 RepID=A0AAU9CZY8_9LACO|nr:mannitol-1-phosphate 5-dehydrogenase [Xylocopilactobacillus apis]BDR55580.1 mannitol-1-phosphate 5-dehydrogenase [Xylocopilactobacillus apis]
MKKAVHFGAGNIGRGFVGEILSENNFSINFVDVNDSLIDALSSRKSYEIELADESHKHVVVENVSGINNAKDPQKVIDTIVEADVITTAIGPKILPIIAPLIAQGLDERLKTNKNPIDVIACENMIGASQSLKDDVYKSLKNQGDADQYVGFPNAAVDRIVPAQNHDDLLMVTVEPFHEWVVDASQMKNSDLKLEGVHYVPDLEPYIERKLFTVNTGHATIAYMGHYLGYQDIKTAISDEKVLAQLHAVLAETGGLLIKKWKFDGSELESYQDEVVGRFMNPDLSDAISRIARTPIRKLGYNERFIRPIRETDKFDLPNEHLIDTVGMLLHYSEPSDEEAVELRKELDNAHDLNATIEKLTGLSSGDLVDKIRKSYEKYSK